MMEFLDYDVILSPFTSYPRNEPEYILSYKPFERIYDDTYIFDSSDYANFVRRAYAIYSHFAEILYLIIKDIKMNKTDYWDWRCTNAEQSLGMIEESYEIQERRKEIGQAVRMIKYLENIDNYIDIILRLAIHYWNIAVSRFDALARFIEQNSSMKYHIISNNMGIQVIDLQTNMVCLDDAKSKELFGNISLFPDTIDPADSFDILQPCKAFHKLGLEVKNFEYKTILKDMRSIDLSYG
jgi:hypothetical protein